MKNGGGIICIVIIILAIGGAGGIWLFCNGPTRSPSSEEVLENAAPPPSEEGLREVVETGMLSLVEAQHTFYMHVKQRERFAENMREMGCREDENFGSVLVMDVWHADYDNQKTPFHGYWFKVVQVDSSDPAGKKGFAIVAVPAANNAPGWPVFITHIRNAKGGIFEMRAADTWRIEDAALISRLRGLLGKTSLAPDDLQPFSPENGTTKTIKEHRL